MFLAFLLKHDCKIYGSTYFPEFLVKFNPSLRKFYKKRVSFPLLLNSRAQETKQCLFLAGAKCNGATTFPEFAQNRINNTFYKASMKALAFKAQDEV